jgi:hypothetical protein
MPDELMIASKFANAVKEGFDRNKRFRKARAMFIKEYVGKYYTAEYGLVGEEPINLIFNTIRALVPNLVMKNPTNEITTEFVPYRDYAFLLSKALDLLDEKQDLKLTLRRGIVDALFLLGIFKTGLAEGGKILNFGDIQVDEGQIFTDTVDFDDFVFDSSCRSLDKAAYIGDCNRVSRQILLDDTEYDHDLVMRLPRSKHPDAERKVSALTQGNLSNQEIYELQDYVDVVELFVPGIEALITIPDPRQAIFENYLAAREYYGPQNGPYTFLALTQPVPGNPLPVPAVGVWYDLHIMANRMMSKVMDQAGRQKDIAIYDPAGADEAEDVRTSEDGDAIAGNPDTVKVVSFGGQNQKNEAVLSQLQVWYNYMAGNPDQMAGLASQAETATQAQILQGNANITIQDMRDIIDDCSAEINKKQAWYLHTDPLLDQMLSIRKPGGEQIQLHLTPEQRRGDFFNYTFKTKSKSMRRLDPAVRAKRIIDFGTNTLQSVMMSAQVAMQMGLPFNVQEALTDIAEELGILDEVQDWFYDPTFMQRMQIMMAMGPQPAGRASAAGTQQNQGSPTRRPVATPATEMRQGFQAGANDAQSMNQGVY